MERVVVWQSAFLGDLVLTSNLLLNLHLNFPKGEIVLVSQPFGVELFGNIPWLRVIPLEKTLKGTYRVIQLIKGFELGFGVQRGARTSLSLFLAKVKDRVGFHNAEMNFLFTRRVKHRWGIHEVKRNQKLLRAVGLKVHTHDLFLPIEETLLEEIKGKFNLPEEYVVIAPSANFKPKRWLEENFSEVIDNLLKEGINVVLTGGKNDIEVSKRVLSFLKNPNGVIDLTGKTTLRELVGVIKLAKVLLSNDSAPVHIAEAVGTKVLTVYCATSSYYGFYPRRGVYLEPKNLQCHPCKPNPKVCKIKTEDCRSAVNPKNVINNLIRLI